MDANGDISDTFDDEDLAKSIESGKNGPWNDGSAEFEDPKLAHLKKAMAAPPETGYQQRRLQELQERAVKGPAATQAKAAPPAPAPAPDSNSGADWGAPAPVWNEMGTVTDDAVPTEWCDRRSPGNAPGSASTVVNARRITDRSTPEEVAESAQPDSIATSLVISYAPSILAATVVFVAATIVHGLVAGWQLDLLFRGMAAMVITGLLWRRFRTGRLRAMAIAAVTYAALFVPSDRLGEPENAFAVFLGLLITMAGAGMIGVQHDEIGA